MSYILGIKLVVHTAPEVKDDGSYLYIANHQNSYDLITVSRSARPGAVTIGKKSLKWIPVFGLIYWLSGNILIDRKDSASARGTLAGASKKIKEKGLSIYMFPEGTRSRGKGILPFKTGAFRLAQETKQQIVPICCSDLSHIKFNRWNNGTVIIDVMAPMSISSEENAKQIAKRFENLYKEKLVSLTKEAKKLSQTQDN
ncbi:1-acylglycerol-3-phosphate O-acyltransferase [Agaribacter flavus]|uniref:1-acyl-sn-glycerol-3-phosphate acyltransferase n=1 Tax=Agaribacter flavus TaxID=1902781 RepID=A0ABV7FV14_9ALTE